MDEALKKLFENDLLTEDVKKSVQEAWNNKIKQVKEEVENSLKEEYTVRFKHDKNLLVEAMNRLLNDAIKEEMEEFAQDKKLLVNQRVKYVKAIKESKLRNKKDFSKNMKAFEGFFVKQLNEELKEFRQDRKKLNESRNVFTKKVRKLREAYKVGISKRINKLDSFVMKQLIKEIDEFHTDKKALVESRVNMVTEGRQKINEARKSFIKRASILVERTVEDALRKELTQFRDDVKVARENNFGRRVFEAFSSEYMASYLSEGSKVKELMEKAKSRDAKLTEAIQKIEQQQTLLQEASTIIKVAQDRATRVTVMNELLKPLGREKSAVMEELLESVKTSNLRDAYHKYLPAILNETKSATSKKTTLKESKVNMSVAVTGDRKNKLTEAIDVESNDRKVENAYVQDIRKLAGLSN